MPTILIEGATSGRGAVTEREYDVAAEEQETYRVPEGETESLPSGRVTVLNQKHADDRVVSSEEDLFGQDTSADEDAPGNSRSFTSNGSWKTLYEDGEEVRSVQCTAEEAKRWVQGETTLSDLKD